MKFAFYSGMDGDPWGGSEELWSRAALALVKDGHVVSASVKKWSPPARQIGELRLAGIRVAERNHTLELTNRVVRTALRSFRVGNVDAMKAFYRRALSRESPDLLVVSHGGFSCALDAMEVARDVGVPYVCVAQSNSESLWPTDDLADRLVSAYAGAVRNYFVSDANRQLFFRQIGQPLPNCTVVHNPPNQTAVRVDGWPVTDVELSLACVARLDAKAKGQDLLFELLAGASWGSRSVRVHLYGGGVNARSLRRHARSLGIESKVRFEGYVNNVAEIWGRHHALVLPSRFEGTPLALIEAMSCARPSVCTAVAGIPELMTDGVSGFLAAAPTVEFVGEAMERLWAARHTLQGMGERAYAEVRTKVPADPVKVFAQELLRVGGGVESRS